MYVQDNLFPITTNVGEIFLDRKFLLTLSVLVLGPFTVLARASNAPTQPGLLWSFMGILLLLLIDGSGGFWRCNSDFQAAARLSIAA